MSNKTKTYDPSFFEELKIAEKSHFWYQTRSKWIYDTIAMFLPPPAGVLEVGCGTGNVSSFLSAKGYTVTGCEYYQDAIDRAWPGFTIVKGDAYDLPFDDNSFDIVGLFDVLEHFEDDEAVIAESRRVLKPGGFMALTVPAREELWSSYDEDACHKRRYSKRTLMNSLTRNELNIRRSKYIFMSLYAPMKYARAKNKHISDHMRISKFMNGVLSGLFYLERIISRIVTFPIGTSIIAIAQKPTQ